MLFSSVVFIFYFLPIVLAVYYLLRFSRRIQNIWLLAVSLFFYAWGEPVFIFVLMLSVFFNYRMGLNAEKNRGDNSKQKRIILLNCFLNLGLLFVYKYLGFVLKNFGLLFGIRDNIPFSGLLLPLGISFFTFQAISYVIDISRGEADAQKSFLNTALYIMFFPQLIAGPIVRYTDIEDQIMNRKSTWDDVSYGVCRFITGLAKKVLISNTLATIADHSFNFSAMSSDLTKVPVLLAWMGVIAFMLQIYFDFSGYSDMAIGLARMFGFKFKENFDYPYTALSISDFWRRWYKSLYTWIRNYVYFPLGGSRVSNNDKMVRNLFIVWLLTGIWYGAEWTFLIWGIWQFAFILFERVVEFEKLKYPPLLCHIYVIFTSLFGWVLFRANDLYQVMLYYSNMLGLNHNGFFSDTALMFLREYWLFFVAAIIFSTPIAKNMSEMLENRQMGKWNRILTTAYPVLMMTVFAVTISYLIKGTYNPFIYFNF